MAMVVAVSIYANNANLVISASEIVGNKVHDGGASGGAIYFFGSGDLDIAGSLIAYNTAERGGGVSVSNTDDARFEDVIIAFNRSGNGGGGIEVSNDSTVVFEDVTITGNRSGNNSSGSDFHTSGTASHITFRDSIIASEEDGRSDRFNIRFNNADTVVYEGIVLVNQEASVRDGFTIALTGNSQQANLDDIFHGYDIENGVKGGLLWDHDRNVDTLDTILVLRDGPADVANTEDEIGAGPAGNARAVFSGDTDGTVSGHDIDRYL